jgi:hypothetical protein
VLDACEQMSVSDFFLLETDDIGKLVDTLGKKSTDVSLIEE